IPDILPKSYRNARREASAETGLLLSTFSEICPYDIQEILNPEFLCNTTDDFEKASPNLSPTRGEALKPPFPGREGGLGG
ncbi:MAG: DUF29 family protein, partial [Aphanizomenon gracile PMC627.10]|nr:DUF29 family protein [Aphanizomenon gracile PMC627.10]